MDVVAAEDLDLQPGQRHAVATGFKVAIPEGYEIQVRPRSGLALAGSLPSQRCNREAASIQAPDGPMQFRFVRGGGAIRGSTFMPLRDSTAQA